MRTLPLLAALCLTGLAPTQELDELKAALGDDRVDENWIYGDLAKGYAEAKRTGKPLLVGFR